MIFLIFLSAVVLGFAAKLYLYNKRIKRVIRETVEDHIVHFRLMKSVLKS
jgi:ethanolamine ammonia-lyase large subunit